jgi:Cdc6-like AAA superfamily ATPase
MHIMRGASKKERERSARVTREKLREATEVLGISIVWDRDVDLRKAKKIMLQRCAQLHPDKTGSMSDAQKTEYTAVVDAYKTLERYMEGRKSHAFGERSHEGQ